MGGQQTQIEAKRAQMIALHKIGLSLRAIARQLETSRTTVIKWIKRHEETGNLTDRERRPRPRSTTHQEDKDTRRAVEANPFTNAVAIQEALRLNVTPQTVRTRLREAGFHHKFPAKKKLTDPHQAGKFAIAHQCADEDLDLWSRVMFSDKETFSSKKHRKHNWMPNNRRQEGERCRSRQKRLACVMEEEEEEVPDVTVPVREECTNIHGDDSMDVDHVFVWIKEEPGIKEELEDEASFKEDPLDERNMEPSEVGDTSEGHSEGMEQDTPSEVVDTSEGLEQHAPNEVVDTSEGRSEGLEQHTPSEVDDTSEGLEQHTPNEVVDTSEGLEQHTPSEVVDMSEGCSEELEQHTPSDVSNTSKTGSSIWDDEEEKKVFDILRTGRSGNTERRKVYHIRRKFKISSLEGKDRIIRKKSGKVMVTKSTIQEAIKSAHILLGHAEEKGTWNKVKTTYDNIPLQAIKDFISACNYCIEKCKERKGSTEQANLVSHLNQHDDFQTTEPVTTKDVCQGKDEAVLKMENALSLWMEDISQAGAALDSDIIRKKAESLYENYRKESEGEGTSASVESAFTASKEWFDDFQKRIQLKNMRLVEEVDSVDPFAAERYPLELKAVIEERGYLPEQVFSVNHTALYWKRMPSRTFIMKEEEKVSGFKTFKDRLTLVVCVNAAGFMMKPGLIYKSRRPRALKNKDLHTLPVFWMHNAKAWMTKALFKQWYVSSFLSEVRAYLESKGLPQKVLLLMDKFPGHPEVRELRTDVMDVEIGFIPSDTASSIQPLEQGITRNFKAQYTHLCMVRIVKLFDDNSSLTLTQHWKEFSIADCLALIQQTRSDMKPATVSACWKNLWPDVVPQFSDLDPVEVFYRDTLRNIIAAACKLKGDGFTDMREEDIEELIMEHRRELSDQDLSELVKCAKEEDVEDPDDDGPQPISMEELVIMKTKIRDLRDYILEKDSNMNRALRTVQLLDEAFAPHMQELDEIRYQMSQTRNVFFPRRPLTSPSQVPFAPSSLVPTRPVSPPKY